MRLPWMNKKPLRVEWDLTGTDETGFGAVVYLTSAPVRIVKEIEPGLQTYEEVAGAVDSWVATVSERYVLNSEFQDFKATARGFSNEESPERKSGQWWRPLDS